MDLSQAFLEQLGIRNGNRDLIDHPGDTCSQGHPFEANDAGECVSCCEDIREAGARDIAEDSADYRTLTRHVFKTLNPPRDGDVEVETCMDAITAITDYVESLPCRCAIKADGSPCARCRALGRQRDEKVQR
jgi:hypothetical protein